MRTLVSLAILFCGFQYATAQSLYTTVDGHIGDPSSGAQEVRIDWIDDIKLVPTWRIPLDGAVGQTFVLDSSRTSTLSGVLADGTEALLQIIIGPAGSPGGGGHAIGEFQLWETQVINADLFIESNFTPENGVDMEGHRLTQAELIVDAYGTSGFDYRLRLYGIPIPEPKPWALLLIGFIFLHYHTPYGCY